MPLVAAAPNIERTGVIAGFVLSLGAGLTPAITRGVLFAQGTMYRPESAPSVPAAGASDQSWLFYNSSTGFYWASSFTPATAGDAFLGWAVTSASEVIAVSVQWIGETGEGPAVLPLGSVQPSEGVQLPVPPGDVTLTTVDVLERFVRDGAQFQRLGLKGTVPDPAGTFKGVHVYAEIPDASDPDRARVDQGIVGTSVVGPERHPLDLGKHPYVAADVYLAVFEIPNVESDTLARTYAVSYSPAVENGLVYADQADPTPSLTIALTPNPVVILGEEYAPNASGFAVTRGYPWYELRNNVWSYQLGFEWIAPTDSPRISALTGYQIVFEYADGSRAPAGLIAPDQVMWISGQWACPVSETIIAWLCSEGVDGENTIVEGVTPKLTIPIARPTDVSGQEYAALVVGQTASVTVEQTADGIEVYTLRFGWNAPANDELAQVHVWAQETERDDWVDLGVIPAEDNGEQFNGPHPLSQSNTFTLWFYSVARDGRENTHNPNVSPHVHLAQIKPSTAPTIIRGRVIPIVAPPVPAANSSTIQTATIGGVPSFRFHLVTATGGGTTEGYVAQGRYYSDAAATVPTSDWIPLGWIDPSLTTLDTDYWPRPAVQDYAKVRIAAQTADNTLGPWLESAILTRPASTGLSGASIEAATLVTAAFASTIRPVTLVTTSSALPSLPDPLYPPGSVAYIIDAVTLVKVNAANNAWEKMIHGGNDIQAGTITANDIYAHTITAGQIAAGAISTTELYAGEILVGAGGGKPTRFRVNDSGGNQVAFIGDNGAGFVGGFFVNVLIGPTIGAPVITANSGGVTINGATFTLNLNGITTRIENFSDGGFVGLSVKNNTSNEKTYVFPDRIVVVHGSTGYALVTVGGQSDSGRLALRTSAGVENVVLDATSGTGLFSNWIEGLSLRVNGSEVVNSSKQFVGAGVVCTGYGVAASGFNPYVGGVQYYGATGSVYATLIRSNAGDLEYYNGSVWVSVGGSGISLFSVINTGVTALNFKGGAIV